ncbi:type II secretion system protein [Robertmurraya sp. FSL R5-0851]|uniref:type II secretion system protein n=1 Tax=Robertmurraya sp. FSL R5-0851 TaxID=2921584 RepID=UPI0030FA7BB8
MLKSLKKKMKDQAGLTLIELLVVIVILGIIAAVAIPMVMNNKNDALINTNKQNQTVLQDAVNRYYTVEGSYPSTIDGLAPKYIDSIPNCAEGGTGFALNEGKNKVTTTCKVN